MYWLAPDGMGLLAARLVADNVILDAQQIEFNVRFAVDSAASRIERRVRAALAAKGFRQAPSVTTIPWNQHHETPLEEIA